MAEPFQFQGAGSTSLDRYPREFFVARSVLQHSGGKPPRVLSFGCSTGEEAVSLLRLFGGGVVVGLDTSAAAIKAARSRNTADGRITYDISSPESLRKYAPYDIIFAMSVLCAWPKSREVDDISTIFPFSRFEEVVRSLDSVLRPGGVLVLFNCNFEFLDTSVSRGYEIVLSNTNRNTGFVHRFSAGNRKISGYSGNNVVFRKKADTTDLADTPTASARVFTVIDANGRPLGRFSLSRLA